jgi:glycosyltransferase involved in cell wall biosynthesis
MNSVAVFSDALWPLGSGGELATYLYAELMQDLGIKPVFIVNKANDSRKHFEVVELRRLGRGKYVLTLNIKSLIRILRDTDVAYFTSSSLEFIPLVKELLNKPVVVHIHSYYPCCPIGHMYNFHTNTVCDGRWRDCAKCIWKYEAQRRNFSGALLSTMLNATAGRFFLETLSMADRVIFVSEAQRKLFLEATSKKGLHISSKKTQVIYNPIPDLKPVEMEGDDVGFLGGFDPIKGFKILYQAWTKIFPKYPSNKLHVTKGYKLPREFESKGIMSYGYLMPPIEILKLIRKVRAITVPSLSPEPAPYSAVEACLYGRLLIASEIGGIPEIVGGLPGVKLISPGDKDELSDALNWALSISHNEAVELGLKNRENILKHFNNFKSAKELIRVFERVTS